jgi:hypothetical protein
LPIFLNGSFLDLHTHCINIPIPFGLVVLLNYLEGATAKRSLTWLAHHHFMKKIFFSLTLTICVLANVQVFAHGTDSVLVKYRASQKFGFGDFAWDTSTIFYLAQKRSGAMFRTVAAITRRRLGDNWDIIQYDAKKNIEQLKHFYSTVVPASNLWKFSDEAQLAMANGSKVERRLYRLGYLPHSVPSFLSKKEMLKLDYPNYHCADVWIDSKEALLLLADEQNIVSVSLAGKIPHTEQALQRIDFSANGITAAREKMAAISGRGTVVSLKENLFDSTDIDFKKRFFTSDYSPSILDNHASIMATMLGGSGNSYYLGKGAAWQSTITPADFSNLMPEPADYYSQYKIDVQNHSYGTGVENQYAEDAAAYDLTSWDDTSLLHVFSSGNAGTSASGNGVYKGIAGWANMTGSFKMSKNSLAIGGTDSFFQVQALSSKGPAYDGRIKPDLVAFGEDGTSGAAALVTGCALLLQQKLAQQLAGKPSAALVKALLINGADDLGDEGPDFISGYGNLNVLQSLQIADAKKYYAGVLSTAGVNNYLINIPANARNLKVTLVWTDTPATALSSTALVNDLDVELHHQPTGTIWYPWIKSSAANKDSLQLPAIRGADHLNTVEMISLKQPVAGAYDIVVKAFDLISKQQTFAIVYQWEMADTAAIVFPAKTDMVFANEAKQIVRWQSSFSNGVKGKLELKTVDENTWKLLTDTLPMQQLWYQWKVPDVVAKAQLRMTAGNKIFISDTFLISKPVDIQVGFACDDSVLVYWNKIGAAQRYKVYNLGDTLMQSLAVVTDTFYTIKKGVLSNNFLAVAPVVDNVETARSYTIDYETQGVGCYIKNFLADLIGGTAELQLALGSEYNVNNIVIEKQVNGVFTNRQSITPSLATLYSYTDSALQQGVNAYRIKIELAGGRVVYSQVETIYYTGDKLYVLYPNPVSRQQNLFVINRFMDGSLYASLYDMAGRLVKRYSLPQPVNEVYIKDIPAGVYLILFNDGSKKLGVQKLVVF